MFPFLWFLSSHFLPFLFSFGKTPYFLIFRVFWIIFTKIWTKMRFLTLRYNLKVRDKAWLKRDNPILEHKTCLSSRFLDFKELNMDSYEYDTSMIRISKRLGKENITGCGSLFFGVPTSTSTKWIHWTQCGFSLTKQWLVLSKFLLNNTERKERGGCSCSWTTSIALNHQGWNTPPGLSDSGDKRQAEVLISLQPVYVWPLCFWFLSVVCA